MRKDTDELLAGLFTFVGFRFLLYVDLAPLPDFAWLPGNRGWASSSLLRVKEINREVAGKRSHYIHFIWDLP